ncbi:MAG: alcohol dehydrogenase catalytic domain-containing protein [Clostridiales bacterium]|nr:alcohol dehydrogenase catalytic domain-containing protein [Clostridiales bacterium]
MRAAVLHRKGDIRLEDRPIPRPAAGEILVKVKSAAICGTDLRMWKNGVAGDRPVVLGHEIAGVVAGLGDGVRGYAEGDRVSIAPNMGCGVCDECVAGRTHMCADYRALGIQLDGGFQEYVIVPADAVTQGNVCKLGQSIGYDEAAVVEPFSCVYNAFEGYAPKPGDIALIVGTGPIGIMHAKLMRMAGAAVVLMNDLSKDRLDACAAIEPTVKTYFGDDLVGHVARATGGKGLNVCVTACPSPEAQAAALPMMALYGRVCFFGGLPAGKDLVPLNTNLIHYRQLVVTGSTRASLSQYRRCLSLVDRGVVDIAPLITDRFPIERIGEAFQYAASAGGLKSVIYFD